MNFEEKIKNTKELEFAIFCIENIAKRLETDACFAGKADISLDDALDFFYHSEVYHLVCEGISDMHCMSDAYLAEELEMEYEARELVGRELI